MTERRELYSPPDPWYVWPALPFIVLWNLAVNVKQAVVYVCARGRRV